MEYLCPIRQTLMEDPVHIGDGRTYEREAIQEWYDQGDRTCPMNRDTVLVNPALLGSGKLIPSLTALLGNRDEVCLLSTTSCRVQGTTFGKLGL